MKFVIRYTMDPPSYYRGPGPSFPRFGGTLDQAVVFDTRIAAARAMDEFPLVACVCSEIEELGDGEVLS